MIRISAVVIAVALLPACSAAQRSPAASPSPRSAAPVPAASASPSQPAATIATASASSDTDEDDTDEAAAPARPSTAPAIPTPSYVAHPVAFERPYKLGLREHLADKDLARDDEQELARWNEGGRRERWHPQPRVVVDNVRVQGKASASAVLREARKNGYWVIRRCYAPALPADQQLHGKLSMRLTLQANGKVSAAAITGRPTLEDKDVLACMRKSFRGVELVRTHGGTAKVTLDIMVNPGDAPMKAIEDPPVTGGSGVLDPAVVQALVAAGAGAAAQRCYEDGVRRVPGLWGRLTLRADVSPDGLIGSLVETESTFPDPATTSCIVDAIRAVRLPQPKGGELRLVIPLRLGTPG